MTAASYLTLDNPIPDRALAQRLPSAVARRCRALPVAQANGCITVAMADPDNQAARAAVVDALSASSRQGNQESIYVVQGDPTAIDAWLAELWPVADATTSGGTVWLWQQAVGESEQLMIYATSLAALLGASLLSLAQQTTPAAAIEAHGQDLLLFPCQAGDALSRWLCATRTGPATLLLCQPRWPLRKVLVIVRGDAVDDSALRWAARLARPSGAAITALMAAPTATAGSLEPNDTGIPALLSPGRAVGRKMQHVAQALADLRLDGTLRLRQGAPESVIREELTADAYDLAVAGIAVCGPEAQWRLRPLLDKLLPELSCPLLLTGASDR